MPMIRGQYRDFFYETMLPALSARTWTTFTEKPRLYNRLLDVRSTSRSIEQYSQMTGVGMFTEIKEGADTPTDNMLQGFDKTFKPLKFGLGIAVSQELIEDDKVGIAGRRAAALGISANQTIKVQAASVFNNGFNTATQFLGPDQQPLFSLAHPLVKSGGVQNNMLVSAADLDVTSLELALTDWETQKTAEGFFQSCPTPRLLVAPANRWNAFEILKSPGRSDTANSTANAFKYAENGGIQEIIVWAQLMDPDAWFLVAPPDQTGLLWLWRKKPYPKSDYIERNETGYLYMRYRADYGFYDWNGVYGVPGA